jgi:hypothetical protein
MEENLPPLIAWSVVVLGYLLPLSHVIFCKDAGAWSTPKDGRCPFSPRVGWLVIVMLLGIFGWLLFLRARRRTRSSNS